MRVITEPCNSRKTRQVGFGLGVFWGSNTTLCWSVSQSRNRCCGTSWLRSTKDVLLSKSAGSQEMKQGNPSWQSQSGLAGKSQTTPYSATVSWYKLLWGRFGTSIGTCPSKSLPHSVQRVSSPRSIDTFQLCTWNIMKHQSDKDGMATGFTSGFTFEVCGQTKGRKTGWTSVNRTAEAASSWGLSWPPDRIPTKDVPRFGSYSNARARVKLDLKRWQWMATWQLVVLDRHSIYSMKNSARLWLAAPNKCFRNQSLWSQLFAEKLKPERYYIILFIVQCTWPMICMFIQHAIAPRTFAQSNLQALAAANSSESLLSSGKA